MTTLNDLLSRYTTQSQMSSFFIDQMGILNILSYSENTINDGVTSAYDALVAAAVTLTTNGGGCLYFPPGDYYSATVVTFPDNVTFWGHDATIKGNVTNNLFNIGSNTKVLSLNFDSCVVALVANADSNIYIGNNCKFTNIGISAFDIYGGSNIKVENNYFYNITQSSITIDNDASDIIIHGNVFDNPDLYGGYAIAQSFAHIYVLNGDKVIVSNNVVKNNGGQGIILAYNSTSSKGTTNSIAVGNYCEGNGQEGITSYGGSSILSYKNIIANNICRNNRYHQIEVWQSNYCNVIGNTVEEDTNTGNVAAIMCYSSEQTNVVGNNILKAQNNGICVTGSDYCAVKDNLIFDTNAGNYSGVNEGNGIELDNFAGSHPTHTTIKNNDIYSVTNKNYTVEKYGIYSTSNTNQYNDIENNRSKGYYWTYHSYALLTCYNRSTAIPTSGIWRIGDTYYNTTKTAGGFDGWICTSYGTSGTLSGVTGDITISTATLEVSDADDLSIGDYITIVGVTGNKMITAISGTTITINVVADATVVGAAVAYVAPTFKKTGYIELSGSATYNPPDMVTLTTTTTTVTVTGAALGDYVVPSFSLSLGGLTLTAYVSSTDTVTCVLFNPTTGNVNIAEGTLSARVIKA